MYATRPKIFVSVAVAFLGCTNPELDPEPGEVCLPNTGLVSEYCDPNVCVNAPIQVVRPEAGEEPPPLIEHDSNSSNVTLIGYLSDDGDQRVALTFGTSVKTDSSSANLLAELNRTMILVEVPTRTRDLSLTALPAVVDNAEVVDGQLVLSGLTPLEYDPSYASGISDVACSSTITPQPVECLCNYDGTLAEMQYELRFGWPYP